MSSSCSSYMYGDYRTAQFAPPRNQNKIRQRYYTSLDENIKLDHLLQQKEDECWELDELLQQKEKECRKLDQLLQQKEQKCWRLERKLEDLTSKNIRAVYIWNENRILKEMEYKLRIADDQKTREIETLRKLYYQIFEERMAVEEDYTRACRQYALLSAEKELISIKLEDIMEENKRLHKEKKNWSIEKREAERRERELWTNRFSLMQNERQTLLKKIMLLEKQNKTLQNQAKKDKEKLQQELADMRKLYEDLEEKQNRLMRQFLNLEMNMKVNDAENIQRELTTVKKRKKELEEEHRRFDQEREDMKLMHLVVLNKKEDEIRKMERNLQTKDTEIKYLESKLIDVQKAQKAIPETSEYQRLHKELDKTKKEKSSLEIRLEENIKSMEEKEKKRKDLNVSLLQLEKENEQLNDKLSKMKKDAEYPRYAQLNIKGNEQLQAELQNTRSESEAYRHRISTLEHENASAMARYERAESKIRNTQCELLQKQSEIQSLKERIRQKETENNILQQDSERTLERKTDLEKDLIKKNQNLQENLNLIRFELTKCQEENSRLASKINEKTDHKLNMMKTEEQRLLKRNSQLESENSKLRESIRVISKEKDEALTRIREVETELKISNVDVQQKMKQFRDLQERISQKEEETKLLRKQLSEISKGNERKIDFEQENRRLQESLKKLQAQNKIFEEKIASTSTMLEESEKQLRSMKIETRKQQDRVTQLTTENHQLREDIAEVSKEKDNALTRLSKVAGAKLTHGNAAITDLSDTNRPTKIAEKFSELYDNQWTDAFEELDNTYNNEEQTIQVLLNILQEAYSFCVRTETNYETRIEQAVFTLADEKNNEFRQITGTDVPVQKALTDLRLSLGNACCSIMEEMFLARLPSILKMVDVSVSPKTKLYARQCASLCWRMRIRDPPVFVRFEFRRGTEFNTDILRRYTKTGGYLDFIVWPALYLHENGPVLSKGVAQPKHSP